MTTHKAGTREQGLKARLELLKAEKELTRRSDELARQRQELPWVPINKGYRFETGEGSASLADLFRGRSQLIVYHFMFGPDFAVGCPSGSSIADGFNGIAVHLANHDVMLWAVSRAPLAKLQVYKRRMGWTFPWASSVGGDFNFDFCASYTKEQQRKGIEYNFTREPELAWRPGQECGGQAAEDKFAAMCGTDAPIYHTYLHLCARSRRPLGDVPVARPSPKGAERDRRLVEAPRRVRQVRSDVMARPGTSMFLIGLERKNWQAVIVPTAKQRRERQIRAILAQRRFRRRKSGMNKTQESKVASSIFIGRWTPKILFSLGDRPYRHGQLRRHLGSVSQRMFTRTLRNLESAGLIVRHVTQAKAIAVEYSLTQRGRTILAPLGGMCRWARRYRKDVSAEVRLREAETG